VSNNTNTPGKKKPVKTILLIIAIAAVLVFALRDVLFKHGSSSDDISTTADHEGKLLAEKYCQSCHLLPDPSLLDKQTWKSFLPEMGLYLGIKSPDVSLVAQQDKDFYPAQPVISNEQWQSILQYYEAAAPASLPHNAANYSAMSELSSFTPLPAPPFLERSSLRASFVKIDKRVTPARLFVFDANSKQLFLFNSNGFLDSLHINGIIVDMSFARNEIMALSIGDELRMGPDKDKNGSVIPITINAAGKMQAKAPVIKGLARPVQILNTDINGDHQTDYVIAEFGKLTGTLSWFQNNGTGGYNKHDIRAVPGSVKVYAEENKETGRNDLWVLFAQGNEGIFRLDNKADGRFEEHQVLKFPPSYGSTSFERIDINKDGFKDIVYTCGDNGDGTPILKPYHGIYVFINDGKDHFEQRFFYPLNGCYKVVASDFNHTGNIDLAAIGYFTNPAQPEEWFVYLKNNGSLNFTPYRAPAGMGIQNALTMDSGDFNGDGKPDLVIGNDFAADKTAATGPLFVLFESK